MTLKVNKSEIWSNTISDRAGGAADKLGPLTQAGANLEFLMTRRTPEHPGMGVMFIAPITGAKVVRAAQAAGFSKSSGIHSLRIEGSDKPGMSAKISGALAGAGISFRALCAIAIGKKFVGYLALDNADEATKAARLLRRLS